MAKTKKKLIVMDDDTEKILQELVTKEKQFNPLANRSNVIRRCIAAFNAMHEIFSKYDRVAYPKRRGRPPKRQSTP